MVSGHGAHGVTRRRQAQGPRGRLIGQGTGEDVELTHQVVDAAGERADDVQVDRGERADVYAFCVSVWESLFGIKPFRCTESYRCFGTRWFLR